MENRENILKLCEEYIHKVWFLENWKDEGMFVVHNLEQHRMKLHNELCNLFGIDYIKSKDIFSYLDKRIGLDFSKMPFDRDLKNYAEKLLDILIKESDKM